MGLLSSLTNTIGSSVTTNRQNKKQREFDQAMYEQQKQDNIDFYNMQREDEIEFWNMQNEYNEKMMRDARAYDSPAAQAARMRSAGINPDLQSGAINSGSSNSFTANAPNNPDLIAPTTPKTVFSKMDWAFEATVQDAFDIISGIQDIRANNFNLQDGLESMADMFINNSGYNPVDPSKGLALGVANKTNMPHLSKHQINKLNSIVKDYAQTDRAKYKWMRNKTAYADEVKRYKDFVSNPRYGDGNGGMSNGLEVGDALLDIQQIAFAVARGAYELEGLQQGNKKDYESKRNYGEKAVTENKQDIYSREELDVNREKNKTEKIKQKVMRDILSVIDDYSSNDAVVHGLLIGTFILKAGSAVMDLLPTKFLDNIFKKLGKKGPKLKMPPLDEITYPTY